MTAHKCLVNGIRRTVIMVFEFVDNGLLRLRNDVRVNGLSALELRFSSLDIDLLVFAIAIAIIKIST